MHSIFSELEHNLLMIVYILLLCYTFKYDFLVTSLNNTFPIWLLIIKKRKSKSFCTSYITKHYIVISQSSKVRELCVIFHQSLSFDNYISGVL